MIHHQGCPLCSSHLIKPVFEARDHTVSGKLFSIWECSSCTARFTQDVPGEQEIGPYYLSDDYISHTETKKGSINMAYHAVRTFTLQQKKKMICTRTRKSAGNLLDIGCGTGAFLQVMKEAGWEVQGLEPDAGARDIAEKRGVPVLPSTALSSLGRSYDAITMWHVLEHVHNLHGYLKSISNLLKQDGLLFVAVPNYTSGDADHYQEGWAAYDVPRHLYHFSPASVKQLMKLHGLEVEALAPMWFDSFYVAMLSEKYRCGKENILSASWQGMVSNFSAMGRTENCSSVIYIIRKATG
jgi:SAM-dependent methyltransferase